MTELFRFLFALTALLTFLQPANAEDFPQPPELKPDVDFWVSIFTRYSTSEGVLHDSRNLGVVYERIDIPAKASVSSTAAIAFLRLPTIRFRSRR